MARSPRPRQNLGRCLRAGADYHLCGERMLQVDHFKSRPDMKRAINRARGDPLSRLNGLFQLTKGLSGIVKQAAQAKKAA